MSSTAVVILNYNGKKYLESFLPTLCQFSEALNIVVADNASTDDSIKWLENNTSDVELIRLSENYGFAGGYNEALKEVVADYYILINSDVEVSSGWWEPLVDFLEQNPTYAACQPKIKDFHKKNYFEYAGAGGGYVDSLGYPYCRGRLFDVVEKDHGQYDKTADIFWSTGACMIIRAELYHQVGGFDSDFFAHMEEVDLCWRLQNAGWKIACVPHSTVYHVGGGTLSKTNPKKTYLNFRNNLAVITKNLPLRQLWWKLPLRIMLDVLAGFVFWKTNSFGHFKAVIQAILHYAKNSHLHFQKRQAIKPLLKAQASTGRKAVIYDFFVAGKKKYQDL